jgi:hypothetical protein
MQMNPIFRLIEITVLIVLPLLIFYLRSCWSKKEIYFNVTVLPILWYLTYALLHELSHIVGCIVVGAAITDYRLIPHFWEGDFGFAYVDVNGGLDVNTRSLIILSFPYVLDVLSVLIGFVLLNKLRIKNSFLFGLMFMILCLRPLYDIIDNYIGIIMMHSDLVLISKIAGQLITYSFGIAAVIFMVTMNVILLRKYKGYPYPLLENKKQ